MTFKASDSLSEQIAQHLAARIIRGELKERERIQEQKVTQAMNVSRGSVREALLILERRHLITILPRRGAQVSELTQQHVRSLYTLVMELYILLGYAVTEQWRSEEDLLPFRAIQERLAEAREREDILAFVDASFAIMQAAYPFADNPFLQQTLDNLQPAIARTYYIALERRRGQMGQFGAVFDDLLQAVIARDQVKVREVLLGYCKQNCELVLAALAER